MPKSKKNSGEDIFRAIESAFAEAVGTDRQGGRPCGAGCVTEGLCHMRHYVAA